MKQAIYLGFACAALIVGCGARLESSAQERAELNHSAQRTGYDAQRTAVHTRAAASDTAHSAAHATAGVGHALVTGGREVYQTVGGTRHDPVNEERRHRSAEHTREQFGESGQYAAGAARETPAAVGRAAQTVGRGAETGAEGVEHGVGDVRRATGEQPNVPNHRVTTTTTHRRAMGGGPKH